MKNTIKRTSEFSGWMHALKDIQGKARIFARIDAARDYGNFGDCGPVGGGISEMRVDVGPGYRVYFALEEAAVYLLLCGGDKDSQTRDIKHAQLMWSKLKEDKKL
jgi:putative addiction module killer protein